MTKPNRKCPRCGGQTFHHFTYDLDGHSAQGSHEMCDNCGLCYGPIQRGRLKGQERWWGYVAYTTAELRLWPGDIEDDEEWVRTDRDTDDA